MEDTKLASLFGYTAGIIDGEGTIACYYNPKKKNYHQYIRVRMKYPKVPRYLHKNWGGTCRQDGDKSWTWVMSSIPGGIFLREIYPYLVEKKTQARIYLRLCRLKQSHKGPDTPKLAEEKKKLFILLKSLHN